MDITKAIQLATDLLAVLKADQQPAASDGSIYAGPFGRISTANPLSSAAPVPVDPDPFKDSSGAIRWVTALVLCGMMVWQRGKYTDLNNEELASMSRSSQAEDRYYAPNWMFFKR
jgi:hypothetical protein